jgi:GT2 family glycosyltransferase
MQQKPFISIVISNFNGNEITDKCVTSVLERTTYPRNRLRVLVVDDGSTDGSVNFFRQRFHDQIELLEMERNVGFIEANNAGIAYALERYEPDYVMLLNNDTEVVQVDWLTRLVDTAERCGEHMGIIGPQLIFPDGAMQWGGRARERNIRALILQTVTARLNPGFATHEHDQRGVIQVNTVSGACMLIKSALIKTIGMLDTLLAPAFQEDVEYSFRTWRAGSTVLYLPDVRVMHHERVSFEDKGNVEAVKKRKYWAVRNSMLVCLKYFGTGRTLALGSPIFVAGALLDVKDKRKKLGITNVTLAGDPLESLVTLWNSSVDAYRLYKFAKSDEEDKHRTILQPLTNE